MNRTTSLLLPVLLLASATASAQSAWQGWYGGINAGWAAGKSKVTTETVFSPTGGYFLPQSVPQVNNAGAGTINVNGFTGGLSLGYNQQSGSFVYGFELDGGALNVRGRRSAGAVYVVAPTTNFTVTETTKADYLVDLRVRFGVVGGDTLWFATAGVARTEIRMEDTFTDTFAAPTEYVFTGKPKTGWIAGGGFETAIGKESTFKTELLYAGFSKVSAGSNYPLSVSSTQFPSNPFTHTADLNVLALRVGVNWRF